MTSQHYLSYQVKSGRGRLHWSKQSINYVHAVYVVGRASSKESQYELSIKLEFLFHYKKKVTARGKRTVQWMHAFSLYIGQYVPIQEIFYAQFYYHNRWTQTRSPFIVLYLYVTRICVRYNTS